MTRGEADIKILLQRQETWPLQIWKWGDSICDAHNAENQSFAASSFPLWIDYISIIINLMMVIKNSQGPKAVARKEPQQPCLTVALNLHGQTLRRQFLALSEYWNNIFVPTIHAFILESLPLEIKQLEFQTKKEPLHEFCVPADFINFVCVRWCFLEIHSWSKFVSNRETIITPGLNNAADATVNNAGVVGFPIRREIQR